MTDSNQPTATTRETKDLAVLVQQAQSPDLQAVDEAGGQGALVSVQDPSELVPVRPKHVSDEKDQEIRQEATAFVDRLGEEGGV